jgi:uncharacterized protein (TIGR03437 family)
MRNLRVRLLGKLAHRVGLLTFVLTSASALFGQGTLVLSSGTTVGGTVALDLTLTSPAGSEPAGLQWDLTYSATDVVSINAAAAGSAVAAGKSISCSSSSGTYRCLLAGLNTSLIQNGVVAVVTVTIGNGVASTTIGVTNTLGATLDGHALSIRGIGGTLTAPALPTLAGLSCTPATLGSGGTSTCTVTLTKTGGGTVTLSSNTTALPVQGSVAVAAGSTTATFTATAGSIATDQTATLTATLNGSAQTASIALRMTAVSSIASLACNPDPRSTGTLNCTVQLVRAAPVGGSEVVLQTDSSRLRVPPQIQIPAGRQFADFAVVVLASDVDEQSLISASVQGSELTTTVPITGIRPTAVTCVDPSLQAGAWQECEIRMNSPNIPEIAHLAVSSSNPGVRIPTSITTRPGQTRIPFKVYADPTASQQSSEITVQFGQTAVRNSLLVTAAGAPILSLPGEVDAVVNEQATFTVSAIDPGGLPPLLAGGKLPAGASFDSRTGEFTWTPAASQQGEYAITFTATNAAGVSSSGHVTMVVDSGKPTITAVGNAANPAKLPCSPGSLASLQGRWLAAGVSPVGDPTGLTTSLGGTRVRVNSQDVPVVYASQRRIDFVCPAVDPGTILNIFAETSGGTAGPMTTTMQAIGPGVFSVDGSGTGQGLVYLAGTTLIATSRDYRALGQPAEPGDAITIRATGIGSPEGAPPTVMIGAFQAYVESVRAIPGVAGVWEITVEVPLGIEEGDAVPVVVIPEPAHPPGRGAPAHYRNSDHRIRSNQITLAIEPASH